MHASLRRFFIWVKGGGGGCGRGMSEHTGGGGEVPFVFFWGEVEGGRRRGSNSWRSERGGGGGAGSEAPGGGGLCGAFARVEGVEGSSGWHRGVSSPPQLPSPLLPSPPHPLISHISSEAEVGHSAVSRERVRVINCKCQEGKKELGARVEWPLLAPLATPP